MSIYQLPVGKQNDLFTKIAEEETLYLPVDGKNGLANYQEWTDGAVLSSKLNTVRSAKDFFFPQTQNLVDFKTSGKSIEVIDRRRESEDFVIFGVRACDARSFDILDRVFLADPVDTYYETRRSHGTVVTTACSRPDENCFCGTFGIDALKPGGDARTWIVGETLYFEPLTDKGRALLQKINGLLQETDNTKELDDEIERVRKIFTHLPLHDLKTRDFGDEYLDIFHSPKWKELSKSCIGCGACTFVCPTCQCFDIKDFNTGHGIERYRCWDSCMYSDFTMMAAGTPRLTQTEKFRQRFMHKLVYYPQKNEGIFSCVGCGRCLRKCPVSMNIVKVMKAFGGDEHEN